MPRSSQGARRNPCPSEFEDCLQNFLLLLFCGNLNVATSFYCRPWWPGSADWRDRVRLPNHSWSLLRLCTTRKVCQVEKAPEEPSKLANGRVQDKPHWNAQKQSSGHCRRGHRLWEINTGKRQFIEAPILVIYLSQICCKKGTRISSPRCNVAPDSFENRVSVGSSLCRGFSIGWRRVSLQVKFATIRCHVWVTKKRCFVR